MARGRARSAQTQLRVGRLTKAHGLKGGLKLELFTDDPDRRFTPGASFALQVPEESSWHGKRIELAELRWYNGHPVGFFAGITDRPGAESLVKAILWVDQDPAEPAEPDAWYDHQLVGLDVVRDGVVVGVIDRLEHFPAQDLLVVAVGDPSTGSAQRREVLVPFVRAIVPEVDVEAQRVVVTPPEGLFEELPDEPPPPRGQDGDGPGDEAGREDDAMSDERSTDDDGTEDSGTDDDRVRDAAAGIGGGVPVDAPGEDLTADETADAGSADGTAELDEPTGADEREQASQDNADDMASMAASEDLPEPGER